MIKNYLSVFIFLSFLGLNVYSQPLEYDPDLWLPDTIYLALGNTIELYNDDIAFIKLNDTSVHFSWAHEKGMSDSRKFYWTANELGNVKITIKCFHISELVDSASTILKVVRKTNIGNKNILAIGNSLTESGYVYQFQQILHDLNFQINPIGTQGDIYKHEGHGGWMYSTFLSSVSPFYFQKTISYKKYIENNSLLNPDIIRIDLGINECYGNYPMNDIVRDASNLIDTINHDYPNSLIIIALPTISEKTGSGWIDDYGTLSNFEPYILRIRELWKRLYSKYSFGRYKSNIQVSCDGLFIDRTNGYPINDGVHPNSTGYCQLIRGFSNTLNYYVSKTVSQNTQLKITGVTAGNKIYDGNRTATLNTGNAGLFGVIAGDDVTLVSAGAKGTFENKNVGNGISVFASGFSLNGADANKYTLIQPTLAANITATSLTIGGITAMSKTYDGNTAATINGTPILYGVISHDMIVLGGSPIATFVSSNISDWVPVSVTGYTISGPDASNYILNQPVGLSANITAIVTNIEKSTENIVNYSIYPNPTSDFLTLSALSCDYENLVYNIYDNNGTLLKNNKIRGNEPRISMENFKPGMYFIKLTDNKKVIKTFKVIKY